MTLKSIGNKIILTLALSILISCGFDSSKNTTEDFTSSKTKVENVKIKKDNKFAWAVVGMIRNESSSEIKGYVKIKFLNSSGDIVNTTMTRVNDGDSFEPGQAASFDYYTEPDNFDDVTDFDVHFVEK